MADYPCRLRNATTRPVEIHLKGEVLVLNPGACVSLEKADPAVEQLERDGVLTRHAAEAKPPISQERTPTTRTPKAAEAQTANGRDADTRETQARQPKRNAYNKRSKVDTGGSS
jgi:hypothetical protein